MGIAFFRFECWSAGYRIWEHTGQLATRGFSHARGPLRLPTPLRLMGSEALLRRPSSEGRVLSLNDLVPVSSGHSPEIATIYACDAP